MPKRAVATIEKSKPEAKRRRERKAKVEALINDGVIERTGFSIPEWCAKNGYSESFYYKIRKQGLGPRELRVGKKVTITKEADEEWRRQDSEQLVSA
jgi:hypothetical protein